MTLMWMFRESITLNQVPKQLLLFSIVGFIGEDTEVGNGIAKSCQTIATAAEPTKSQRLSVWCHHSCRKCPVSGTQEHPGSQQYLLQIPYPSWQLDQPRHGHGQPVGFPSSSGLHLHRQAFVLRSVQRPQFQRPVDGSKLPPTSRPGSPLQKEAEAQREIAADQTYHPNQWENF